MCHRGVWKAGWQFPNVIRPELKVCGMAFFILTLHVGKPEAATQGREVPQRVRNRFGTTAIERQKRSREETAASAAAPAVASPAVPFNP